MSVVAVGSGHVTLGAASVVGSTSSSAGTECVVGVLGSSLVSMSVARSGSAVCPSWAGTDGVGVVSL